MKSKHRKPESFINQPSFPGGKKSLDEFVKQHLRYPEEAIKNRVEGSVTVSFDIDVFGDVKEAKVKHGIGYGCDEEAVRLIRLLKFEKKRYKGLHVVFHRTLTINFKLHEASAPPPAEQTVKYSFKEIKPTTNNPITYTIRIDPANNQPND